VAKNATIQPTESGTFAVVISGKVLRDNFPTRALAAMWAARQGVYKSPALPRRKPEIPDAPADEQILKLRLAARLTGRGYPRFLNEAKRGVWGELYQVGKNIFGVKLGNIKRGMASAQIK
jgi:hypothetical protein